MYDADPTAMQLLTVVHDTPSSMLPAGELTVGSIAQALPLQASANACQTPDQLRPTAVQVLADVHDTPRSASCEPPG
jgi:hypothetical protein